MTEPFVLGEAPLLTAVFKVGGVLTDPAAVTLRIEAPDGTITTYVWPGTPGPIVKDATGTFSAELTGAFLPTEVGLYSFAFTGNAPAVGANEGDFVIATRIPAPGYSYDLATSVGKLRFLIQDQDLSSVSADTPLEQRSAAFTDAELAYILSVQADPLYAAAMALRVWANNKQLIVIARRNSKATLDYGEIRRDLLAAATAYETTANETPADAIAEQSWNEFNERRIIWNSMLREGTL